MPSSSYSRTTGFVFALIALLHAWRAISGAPVLVGSTPLPIWISWVAVGVAGGLSIWGFRSR